MKNIIRNAVVLALSGYSATSFANTNISSGFEFTGYGRAGISTTSKGGEQYCFGSGAKGHYTGRLGDECDTYAELGLNKMVVDQNGVQVKVNTMLSYQTDAGAQFNDYQSVSEPGLNTSKGDVAFRQFNVTAKGMLESAPEATLWAGKRFYDRKEVNLLDLFYLNNSGYGAGVEGFKLGTGELSLAWLTSDEEGYSGKMNTGSQRVVQINKADVRYALPLGEDTRLELTAIFGYADATEIQEAAGEKTDNGLFLTGELIQHFGELENHFVMQYSSDLLGEAAWRNASGSRSNNTPAWQGSLESTLRFIDWGRYKVNSKVEFGYSVIYQQGQTYDDLNVSETDPTRTSVVLSGAYTWNDYMTTRLEVGYDNVHESDMVESEDLQKVMVSQEWSPLGGLYSRPTIRFYAGSFFGAQAEKIRIGTSDGEDGNIRFGVQVEASW
ncbi:carbohydrate porin [Shewanella acanthi]|uniref:carbohydrate porin n=1 Tax=Shewanella acanthi TaxID=2864212 RepID=UPI001C658F0C|nr:carbohydrate porin [Shewanella acanthi]QYJ77434.1 carbohydrate porin [Shewanella acanthi]